MYNSISVQPVYIRADAPTTTARQKLLKISDSSQPADPAHTIEIVAENYAAAKSKLLAIAAAGQALPDVILLDLPYAEKELKHFSAWLNKNPACCKIPVLYNRLALKAAEIKKLCALNLVDDIVDIEHNFEMLPYKGAFLQMVKEYQFTHHFKKAPLYNVQSGLSAVVKKAADIARRAIDLFLASFLLVLLSPVFIIISIAVLLDSRGPIIYTSFRAGKGYRIFKFYKFRTMCAGADKQLQQLANLNMYGGQDNAAHFFKINNDPRITRLGHFLRNTSLDELPQLINVLIGDMSIVGNRPLPLYEAATLTTNEYAQRFMAPAGITGLWQIKRRGRKEMSVEERVNLDISYAKTNSLAKDLWILAKTPSAMLQKSNV